MWSSSSSSSSCCLPSATHPALQQALCPCFTLCNKLSPGVTGQGTQRGWSPGTSSSDQMGDRASGEASSSDWRGGGRLLLTSEIYEWAGCGLWGRGGGGQQNEGHQYIRGMLLYRLNFSSTATSHYIELLMLNIVNVLLQKPGGCNDDEMSHNQCSDINLLRKSPSSAGIATAATLIPIRTVL